MHKSIIITGPNGSGKTSIAMDIANQYPKNEVAMISSFNLRLLNNPFLFHQCNSSTKLVILDEINSYEELRNAIQFDANGIRVNQRGKIAHQIEPYLIFVCNEIVTAQQVQNIPKSIINNFIHINIEK